MPSPLVRASPGPPRKPAFNRNTISNWRRETAGFQLALCNAQYDRALLFREQAEDLTTHAFDTLRAILTGPGRLPVRSTQSRPRRSEPGNHPSPSPR